MEKRKMITAYNDSVKEYFCSNDSMPSLTESNYYKFDAAEGYKFVKDPASNYIPVGQGSILRNLTKGEVYRYIISEIDSETGAQTGEWKKQP